MFLSSQGLGDKSASWYGIAAYAAYDFLKDFRVALRQEWFNDVDGVRTGTVDGVTLFSTTATLQYNIWKGLYTPRRVPARQCQRGRLRLPAAHRLREEVTGHALGQPLLQVLLARFASACSGGGRCPRGSDHRLSNFPPRFLSQFD